LTHTVYWAQYRNLPIDKPCTSHSA